jgi:HSP20 family molecular chaperone IbpA
MSKDSTLAPTSPSKPNSCVLDFTPLADIFDNEHEVLVVLDAPGTTCDNVSVHVEEGRLKISAQALLPDGTQVEYRRQFRIGSPLDPQRSQATLKDGVLTVQLPKAESAKPRKVEIRAA